MKTLYSKHIVTPQGEVEGYLHIEHGKIVEITNACSGPYEEYSDAIILPGFIDQHTHGWGRGSFLYENSKESLDMMIEDQAKEGVTGFLATTFTDEWSTIRHSMQEANRVYQKQNKGSKLLGVHLEGPFINPLYKGAQKEEYCLAPNRALIQELYDLQEDSSMIKLITLAPELEGAKDVISFCLEHGIQVAAGHTGATFEQMMQASDDGVGGVTHMFSAMTGLHHRKPGVVGAALYNDKLMCEFAKQTGITVRHEMFDVVYRIKGPENIILCTDCLGNGMQKEPYYHAVRDVHFIPDGNRLVERDRMGNETIYDLRDYESLRGIELSFIDSVKNMLAHTPMSYRELALITATNAAKYLKIDDRKGSIEVGKDADLTIVDQNITLLATVVEGDVVYQRK